MKTTITRCLHTPQPHTWRTQCPGYSISIDYAYPLWPFAMAVHSNHTAPSTGCVVRSEVIINIITRRRWIPRNKVNQTNDHSHFPRFDKQMLISLPQHCSTLWLQMNSLRRKRTMSSEMNDVIFSVVTKCGSRKCESVRFGRMQLINDGNSDAGACHFLPCAFERTSFEQSPMHTEQCVPLNSNQQNENNWWLNGLSLCVFIFILAFVRGRKLAHFCTIEYLRSNIECNQVPGSASRVCLCYDGSVRVHKLRQNNIFLFLAKINQIEHFLILYLCASITAAIGCCDCVLLPLIFVRHFCILCFDVQTFSFFCSTLL